MWKFPDLWYIAVVHYQQILYLFVHHSIHTLTHNELVATQYGSSEQKRTQPLNAVYWNFSRGKNLLDFAIKQQLTKICSCKSLFPLKILLMTSWGSWPHHLWATDPVGLQKIDLFQSCCRSIQQTMELFCNLRSTHLSLLQLWMDPRS